MLTTTHYGLQKPDPNDTYNKATDNSNMDAIDAQMYANAQAAANGIPYVVDTSNTANTVTATVTPALTSYTDGLAVCVKIANNTTGATTLNLNGLGAVPIHNGDGSAVGNGDLVAGVPVTLRYVGGASPTFIASGSGGLSGTGNATAANVLAPYTFTSASGKKQTGTMPENGGIVITPGPNDIAIPAGHHDGTGKVSKVSFDATKLLTGTTVAGTAGTMLNKGSVTLTPSGTGTVTIPQGYHDGTGKVSQVAVTAAHVLTGDTVAGVAGTMPNNGPLGTITPSTSAHAIPTGYTLGGTVEGDPALIPSNILSGVSIFGVAGSVTPKLTASGTTTSTSTTKTFKSGTTNVSNTSPYITVTGLSFKPSIVLVIDAIDGYFTVLSPNAFDNGPDQIMFASMQNSNGAISTGGSGFQLDGTSAYANSGTFQLPVWAPSKSYNWYAFS